MPPRCSPKTRGFEPPSTPELRRYIETYGARALGDPDDALSSGHSPKCLDLAMTFDRLLRADELGIRLEIVNGLAIWEPQPLYRHQKHVERIAQGIASADSAAGCACVHALDVYIQFPNGLKRPAISIFCREPSDEEQDRALTLIPEAVVEVVSPDYEAKDLEIGPPFCLSQGVKDIIVFDPRTLLVLHVRHGQATRAVAPQTIALQCGCRVSL